MGNEVTSCSIISGAPDSDISYIKEHIDLSSYIIAADNGYKKCEALGITPNLIVGDFDSSKEPITDIEKIVLPTHKDDTDTMFALKEAIKRGFGQISLYAVIGSRADHSLGNILSLNFCRESGAFCKIFSSNSCIYLCDDFTRIDKNNGYKFFSVYPYLTECSGVSISGAQYNLDNADFSRFETLGQSNEVVENYAAVSVKSGVLLIFLSTD